MKPRSDGWAKSLYRWAERLGFIAAFYGGIMFSLLAISIIPLLRENVRPEALDWTAFWAHDGSAVIAAWVQALITPLAIAVPVVIFHLNQKHAEATQRVAARKQLVPVCLSLDQAIEELTELCRNFDEKVTLARDADLTLKETLLLIRLPNRVPQLMGEIVSKEPYLSVEEHEKVIQLAHGVEEYAIRFEFLSDLNEAFADARWTKHGITFSHSCKHLRDTLKFRVEEALPPFREFVNSHLPSFHRSRRKGSN